MRPTNNDVFSFEDCFNEKFYAAAAKSMQSANIYLYVFLKIVLLTGHCSIFNY